MPCRKVISLAQGRPRVFNCVRKADQLEIDSNVIAAYDFPSLVDLTGNGYTASTAGAISSGADVYGQFYDISNDATTYISLPTTAWPGSVGAVEMLVLVRSNAGNTRLFGTTQASSYTIRTYSVSGTRIDGYLTVAGGNIISVCNNFYYNALLHVAFQWHQHAPNAVAEMLVNGVSGGEASQTGTPPSVVTGFFAGLWAGQTCDAKIYQMAVHDVNRTAAQWLTRWQNVSG